MQERPRRRRFRTRRPRAQPRPTEAGRRASAVFEGYFDLESGEPRRANKGIPRLRVADEVLWGFECWWRPDPDRSGFNARDREELETSKRLLRGLLRDARRGGMR